MQYCFIAQNTSGTNTFRTDFRSCNTFGPAPTNAATLGGNQYMEARLLSLSFPLSLSFSRLLTLSLPQSRKQSLLKEIKRGHEKSHRESQQGYVELQIHSARRFELKPGLSPSNLLYLILFPNLLEMIQGIKLKAWPPDITCRVSIQRPLALQKK